MTVCTVGLLAVCAGLFLTEDRTGPVIKFDDTAVTWQAGDSQEELLRGVSAEDAKDGDVSDTIRVDRVMELEEEKQVIVTYVAKDRSNNITKVNRWVEK